MWSLIVSQPYRPPWLATGIALPFFALKIESVLKNTHIETRNRNNTKTNVHTIRSTQHILERKKLSHDVTFKKARGNKYKNKKKLIVTLYATSTKNITAYPRR
jgi:hypothetical protein